MQGKGAGPVNRVELESQVLCAALRQSCNVKDKIGAFTSVRELSHLFPDLLPPPEKDDASGTQGNKADYYDVIGVKPQSAANGVIAAYLRTARKFIRQNKVTDQRQAYSQILNAGFILRKPRLRLSHDLVVARRWLHEESRIAQLAQQEVTVDSINVAAVQEAVAQLSGPGASGASSVAHAASATPPSESTAAQHAASTPPAPPLPAPPLQAPPAPPLPQNTPVPAMAQTGTGTHVPPVPTLPNMAQSASDQATSPVQTAVAVPPPPPLPYYNQQAEPQSAHAAQSTVAVDEAAQSNQSAGRASEPHLTQPTAHAPQTAPSVTPPAHFDQDQTAADQTASEMDFAQPPASDTFTPAPNAVPGNEAPQNFEPTNQAPGAGPSADMDEDASEFDGPDVTPASVRARAAAEAMVQQAAAEIERPSGRISKEAAFVFDESALRRPLAPNKPVPMIIQLLEAAQIIGPLEVEALKAQMEFAPNIPVEKLIMNAGYVNSHEMASVKLGESLLQQGRITMAQFQVAIYDERVSGLRMAESLQVRGWLSVEVRNAIDDWHRKRQ